jgi:futalosine hydrolase
LKILLVFATSAEAEILKNIQGITPFEDGYKFKGHVLSVLITGVGGMLTAWGMKKWLSNNTLPDLAINVGIAGSFSPGINKGDVVIPVSDCFADLGSETDKGFVSLAEAGLMDPDQFPFEKGLIRAENVYVEKVCTILNKVNAITVNTTSGTEITIEKLRRKYNPDIETMEGATFFYICSIEKIPFLALRAISNKVEPRNKKEWDIPLALKSLSETLLKVLLMWE